MTNTVPQVRTADEIRNWLLERLAERLRVEPDTIDCDAALVSLGVDSMQFVVIVGELEDWLGCRFVANPLVQFPSVNALAEFIAEELAAGKASIDPNSQL